MHGKFANYLDLSYNITTYKNKLTYWTVYTKMQDANTQPVPKVDVRNSENFSEIKASGEWTIYHCETADSLLKAIRPEMLVKSVRIDFADVSEFDTSGAWLITRFRNRMETNGINVELINTTGTARILLERVGEHHPEPVKENSRFFTPIDALEKIGEKVTNIIADYQRGLNIMGAIVGAFALGVSDPRRLRINSIGAHFLKMGIGAVPIVCLISFLTGAILCQQGGYYLKLFGADIFIVDLMGIMIFRELGLILTAIMVAGRSGSATTAEIGSMKMREEIDALKTIGMGITEVLILPRTIALVIAMPLLTFFADLAALSGGVVVSWIYLDISPQVFLSQLRVAVGLDTFWVGIVKAPFMAIIIAVIATIEGLKVKGSTDSLGRHTTMSVVKAIFMVIVLDGLFAIFFVEIGV